MLSCLLQKRERDFLFSSKPSLKVVAYVDLDLALLTQQAEHKCDGSLLHVSQCYELTQSKFPSC
jgi:hypothetical protein